MKRNDFSSQEIITVWNVLGDSDLWNDPVSNSNSINLGIGSGMRLTLHFPVLAE